MEGINAAASDADIGVSLSSGAQLSIKEKVQLTIELGNLLGVPRVDLVVLPEVEAFLALDVIKGELIYCDDLDAQAEYELFIMRRVGDLAFYEFERRRQILEPGRQ